MKYLAAILLILILSESWAGKNDADTLKQHQEQLQELLNEINQVTKQRNQHNATIKKLKRQLECNWELIQSYEVCDKLYGDIPAEHLNCTNKAKRNTAQCMK